MIFAVLHLLGNLMMTMGRADDEGTRLEVYESTCW